MKKPQCYWWALLTGALCLTPTAGWAAKEDPGPNPQGFIERKLQEGWNQIAPGVLERRKGEGKIDSLAFGVEGQEWFLQQAINRYGRMLEEYRKYPSEEGLSALRAQSGAIGKAQELLDGVRTHGWNPDGHVLATGCNISFGYNADAYPLTTTQGVGANSSANFYSNGSCPTAEIYADAYARVSQGSTTTILYQYDGPKSGGSSQVAASLAGSSNCFSDAYAWVSFSGVTYSAYDSNSSCPAAFAVSLTGPTYISLNDWDCYTATWTASATGGTPSYTFYWPDGSSGTTFSREYCGYYYYYPYNQDDISVTGYDSGGASDTAALTVTIEKIPSYSCYPSPEDCYAVY